MNTPHQPQSNRDNLFEAAEAYDRSINWSARLGREIPVLQDVFGPPREGGILDAGCGTGHQASALAKLGYRVTGADASDEMLTVARRVSAEAGADVRFVTAPYAELPEAVGGGFDGLYCLANSLAAAGTRELVADAVARFGQSLRVGGRFFLQILNFHPMRSEAPCVRGPRVSKEGDRELISVRQFHFSGDTIKVTNVTLWNDNGWHQRSNCGTLYAIGRDELAEWCAGAGLRIDELWGGYDRKPFDLEKSVDLIVVATRI